MKTQNDPKTRLADEIIDLMGHLNAANYRLLTLIAQMDEQLSLFDGVKSMAHWLNWRCGISMTAAREKVRVAKVLREFPATAAEFRAGRLSYSKVRAITRVVNPFIEADLLNIARYGTAAQLDRLVRGYRTANRDERLRQREKRTFHHYLDEDGMLVVRGRFTPADGAVVLAALDSAVEALRTERTPDADTSRPHVPRRPGAAGADSGAESPDIPERPGQATDTPAEVACARHSNDSRHVACGSITSPAKPPSGESSNAAKTPAEVSSAHRSDDASAAPYSSAGSPPDAPAGASSEPPDAPAEVHCTCQPEHPSCVRSHERSCKEWPVDRLGAENADAITLMARCFLASGPPARLRGEPCEVLVHVDWAALQQPPGAQVPAGTAFYAQTTGLAPDEAQRLTCDASIVPIVEGASAAGSNVDGGGEPLSIGRKRRTVPTGMRRALESRDVCCRFPGCDQQRHLHAHHIQHWAHGGETSLENLALLCTAHHAMVHDGRFQMSRTPEGRLRFFDTHGDELPASAPQPVHAGMGPDGLRQLLARHGITVAPDAADSEWMGDKLHLHYTVNLMCEAERMDRAAARRQQSRA